MKYSIIASALALVAPVFSTPVKRQNIDVTVLQFALTLEHLEDAFYSRALRAIPRSEFFALGFDQFYYDNLKRIADDEKSHVALLTAAITAAGATPVLECTYTFNNFSGISAKDFITLSSVLEGVGTSAYLGGAPLIQSKGYLTVAGSILVTESLHTSYQRNANKEVPFATPYGTPLDPTSVYTLASAFIVSCPQRSTKLPFTAYPALTLKSTSATPPVEGTVASFTTSATAPAEAFLTFVSGLNVTSVPASSSGNTYSAAVPAGDAGQVYVLLTSGAASGNSLASAGTPIAGPAILEVTPQPPKFLNRPPTAQ